MVCDKVRIRFRKACDLRLVSHHDLMRCFERMFRRASIPFHTTSGFNPKPRLVFALSLGLGVVGCNEIAELELTEALAPEEIHRRLAQQAPAGLDILDVQRIDPRAHAQVCRVTYRLELTPAQLEGLADRAEALRSAPHAWIERTRPHQRRFDLLPCLSGLRVVPDALEMDLWVTPAGMARPQEVMALLGLDTELDTFAPVQRISVELTDECQGEAPLPLQAAAGPTSP